MKNLIIDNDYIKGVEVDISGETKKIFSVLLQGRSIELITM